MYGWKIQEINRQKIRKSFNFVANTMDYRKQCIAALKVAFGNQI